MKLDRIHHVAYRCRDAKETVDWYVKNLNMDFVLAIAEDRVPSTHEPDPYMHVFLDAGQGNVLAFFELPTKPEMGRDPNTPEWVQHIAFKVKAPHRARVPRPGGRRPAGPARRGEVGYAPRVVRDQARAAARGLDAPEGARQVTSRRAAARGLDAPGELDK